MNLPFAASIALATWFAADQAPAQSDKTPVRPGKNTAAARSQGVSGADRIEREYQELLLQDDQAQEEIERWAKDEQSFASQSQGLANATLHGRIEQRLAPIRKAYEEFIRRNPKHARARIAFGSFLNETGDENQAKEVWEKAREVDPTIPAVWNNLANYYGHRGPVRKSFEYYAKAIELNPNEPVYFQNMATTVFLFRKDAREFYGLDEQQVFTKALDLYNKALALAPDSFLIAEDLAQTYYGIKPPRIDEALAAWERTLKLAADDVQSEGVWLHMARVNTLGERFATARDCLSKVNLDSYAELKRRVARSLADREKARDEQSKSP